MADDNWPGISNKKDPDWANPRFQRRIVKLERPIAYISNVHEATLDCGHAPLVLGDNPMPELGMMIFCGDCRDNEKNVNVD